MLHSISATATHLGVTRRQASRSVRSGVIITDRIAGRATASDRAIVGARRSAGRGRRWSEVTVLAALDLLEHSATERVAGSERSRLKHRLRNADAGELAYQLLRGRAGLWRAASGAHLDLPLTMADELGLSASGGLTVDVAADIDGRARQLRLVRDGEGDLALIGIDPEFRRVGEALGLYAFGGSRESAAAAAWLEQRARHV